MRAHFALPSVESGNYGLFILSFVFCLVLIFIFIASFIIVDIVSFVVDDDYYMCSTYSQQFLITEEIESRKPISVKFEIPYFTVSGIQVSP